MTIRVVLVDDHDLIRSGLRLEFQYSGDVELAGEANSVASARRMLAAAEFDVLVTDLHLGDGLGLELVQEVRASHPDAGIVMLTVADRDKDLFNALEAGASSYVLKSAPPDEVLAAIRHAAVSPRAFAAADLVGAMQRRMTGADVRLTERETQVLHHLKDGLSVAALAKQMFISNSTAKTYVARLYEKLEANNRAQALMKAVKLGLLADDEPSQR